MQTDDYKKPGTVFVRITNMPKFLLTAFLGFFVFQAVSQNPFDEYIRKRPSISCDDIRYNAFDIMDRLYSERKVDSVYHFLDYWEERCGNIRVMNSLRLVLDIQSGQFNAATIDGDLFDVMMDHREDLVLGLRYFPHLYHTRYSLFETPSSFDSLDQLVRSIAQQTVGFTDEENLILDFFASDPPSFKKISTSTKSQLQSYWKAERREAERLGQGHVAFVTGLVRYTGNISLFGDRPKFGLIVGGKKIRHNYDFIWSFRAGPSRRPYTFQYQDSLITHSKWTGMYLGAEYTFDVIDTRWVDIGLSAGFGYDRITAMTSENDLGEDPKFLNSFNKNTGISIKYRVKDDGLYFGLQFRYNWVDYRNPNGTPLDGEYFNVRFLVGSIASDTRKRRLKTLD